MTKDADKVRLVRGRWLFTGETVLADGAVAVEADKIVAIGPWESLRQTYPEAPTLGSDNHLVLPGLIDAHHHSNGVGHGLQGVDDDFLELWLLANGGMRSQPAYLKTLFSIARLLRSGVTTVVDVASVSGPAADCAEDLDQRLRAYDRAGMRVALAAGASYDSFLVHHEDEAFLASLPQALRQRVQQLMPLEQRLSRAEYLELIASLVERYREHPTTDVWFGPPGPQWVGDEFLVEIADAARRLSTQVQTHAVESFHEKLLGPRHHGKSVIAHLQDLGVLSPRFSIAHGTWVTQQDIEILASTGAAISHNPSSNLRLRAGIAPLNAMVAGGVTVGLGMDGTTLNDDEDMFTEMRLAARLHRTPQFGSPAPSFAQILQTATAGGALLMGQGQRLGKLLPGYQADVVVARCDRITWPWVAPEANPLHVMMMRTRAADVETVLVAGQTVLDQGQPQGFDAAAVGEELADHLEATAPNQEMRALIAELSPRLYDWYAAWEEPELRPYGAFNSRV